LWELWGLPSPRTTSLGTTIGATTTWMSTSTQQTARPLSRPQMISPPALLRPLIKKTMDQKESSLILTVVATFSMIQVATCGKSLPTGVVAGLQLCHTSCFETLIDLPATTRLRTVSIGIRTLQKPNPKSKTKYLELTVELLDSLAEIILFIDDLREILMGDGHIKPEKVAKRKPFIYTVEKLQKIFRRQPD
jgi:hypothetical protein